MDPTVFNQKNLWVLCLFASGLSAEEPAPQIKPPQAGKGVVIKVSGSGQASFLSLFDGDVEASQEPFEVPKEMDFSDANGTKLKRRGWSFANKAENSKRDSSATPAFFNAKINFSVMKRSEEGKAGLQFTVKSKEKEVLLDTARVVIGLNNTPIGKLKFFVGNGAGIEELVLFPLLNASVGVGGVASLKTFEDSLGLAGPLPSTGLATGKETKFVVLSRPTDWLHIAGSFTPLLNHGGLSKADLTKGPLAASMIGSFGAKARAFQYGNMSLWFGGAAHLGKAPASRKILEDTISFKGFKSFVLSGNFKIGMLSIVGTLGRSAVLSPNEPFSFWKETNGANSSVFVASDKGTSDSALGASVARFGRYNPSDVCQYHAGLAAQYTLSKWTLSLGHLYSKTQSGITAEGLSKGTVAPSTRATVFGVGYALIPGVTVAGEIGRLNYSNESGLQNLYMQDLLTAATTSDKGHMKQRAHLSDEEKCKKETMSHNFAAVSVSVKF